MLVKIRERSKGIVAYFLVGLIAIAFSLWGMDSLFTAMRGDPNEVAKVNNESISQFQVDQVAQQQMRQLLQQGQIDADQIDMNLLRQFALNQIIQEQLIQQKTQQLNMQISKRQLERQLVRISSFQDENGRFQQEKFTQLLAQQGLSTNAFRTQLKQDLLAQQLLGGLADSEFILPNEVNEFQVLVGQKRDYRYKLISAKDYLSQVKVTAEEIENFYQQHAQNFQTPEQLRVNYLIFDPKALAGQFTVSEEELKAEYKRYVDNLQNQQSAYSAAHILLTYSDDEEKQQAIERLEKTKQEIQAGADFASKAAEMSEDIATAKQGGKLGPIQAGSLDNSFEQALFALEQPGDLSEIVETEFGLHLIQLTDKEHPEIPAFENLREELTQRVIAQPLRNATSEKLEQLTNLSFSSDNLKDVAEAVELEIQQSDWLIRDQLEGVWAESTVSKAIFADDLIKDGWLTQPLRLADGRYLVAGRETYQPQQQQPLDDVIEQVTAELKQQKATELASKHAQQELEKLRVKEAVAGEWQLVKSAVRNDPAIPRDVNLAAFRLNQANPVSSVRLLNGDSVIIELQEITEGEISSNEADVAQLSLALQQDQSYRMQSSFVKQLERNAKIILR